MPGRLRHKVHSYSTPLYWWLSTQITDEMRRAVWTVVWEVSVRTTAVWLTPQSFGRPVDLGGLLMALNYILSRSRPPRPTCEVFHSGNDRRTWSSTAFPRGPNTSKRQQILRLVSPVSTVACRMHRSFQRRPDSTFDRIYTAAAGDRNSAEDFWMSVVYFERLGHCCSRQSTTWCSRHAYCCSCYTQTRPETRRQSNVQQIVTCAFFM